VSDERQRLPQPPRRDARVMQQPRIALLRAGQGAGSLTDRLKSLVGK